MSSRKVQFLLIGAGLASGNCARWLRESGASGSVVIVGREPDPPYERPYCSKEYLRGQKARAETWFRSPSFWSEKDVEVLTHTTVSALDAGARSARLSDGSEIEFEQALLATGARVRRLNVPGSELAGLHYLRTLGNADAIRADAETAEHVVLIGGSYIGCEVAASLASMGKRCSIVMQEQLTFERTFGKQAGAYLQGVLEAHGVAVHPEQELASFAGDGAQGDPRVARVHMQSGLELEAEMVVIGAGVSPDVGLAKQAGIEIGERGGVRCSSRLLSSAPGIYAGGDICEYESVVNGGRRLRVEHWDVAFNHGKTVALNMLGQDRAHEVVPYFYSDLADWASLEYVGPAYQWDEEVLRGSLAQGVFSTFYLEEGRVMAALSIGRSDDLELARGLIRSGRSLDQSERSALADPDGEIAA